MFSAESVYSVKTAVVSDGLEDTFSILLRGSIQNVA